MTIFYAFLRRRKKTTVSHTFPLVHDSAISTALLSLFPCPHAILRLIDTADLFLRSAVSIVRFYNYWRTKSAPSSYFSLYLERVYRFIRLHVLLLHKTFVSFLAATVVRFSTVLFDDIAPSLTIVSFDSPPCVIVIVQKCRLREDDACTLCEESGLS